ncbi:Hormone-sensitive lipase [Strongyloides ratti]|uniref:Hormone-sensitive lipase n=1 Tax=Strongyloides ratti TaxID=34506 RepID=A0A090LES1_STRRB|nr:Hormone-sensitive lipase [Strongyloides ratti]CEF68232.1 Hormone-sensitive lipase [Strongyloides ratti]
MTILENQKVSVNREDVFKFMEGLCIKTINEFDTQNQSSYATRLVDVCRELSESSPLILSSLLKIVEIAPKFDYDKLTPGNGFRSIVCIYDTAILHVISVLRTCLEHSKNLIFRISYFTKELENYMAVFRFLILSTQQLIGSIDYNEGNSLFPPIDIGDYTSYISVFKTVKGFDASCFYSRPLGLQFCPSIAKMFKVICTFFASYSIACEKKNGPLDMIVNSAKYMISPEERALKIVDIIKEADIEFCKGFWNLPEYATIPKWLGIVMAVCEMRSIETLYNLTLETIEGEKVVIPIPSTTKESHAIKYRMISSLHRLNISKKSGNKTNPLSPYLILHCHGGGYLATSSKSHECYLRSWAKQSNCPIISIDYSLAPESPYPNAIEEVLYAYAYVINYPHKFGWTGEKIVFVGDSAGGNLITSVTMRLISLNVKRMPDALVPIYTPFLFQYLPSPSRLLSFMDPLLHVGMLLRCLTAYTMGDIPINKVPLLSKIDDFIETERNNVESYMEEFRNSQLMDYLNPINHSSTLRNFFDTTLNSSFSMDATFSSNTMNNPENDIEEDVFNQTQNVEVGSNPDYIVLSSGNFDSSLIQHFKENFILLNDHDAILNENNDVFEEVDEVKNKQFELKTPIREKRRSLSASIVRTASLAAFYAIDNFNDWFESAKKPIGHEDKEKLRSSFSMTSQEAALDKQNKATQERTAIDELLKIQIPRNPEISPMYADEKYLVKFPPTYFIGCHLDPLLDDTISFAKKLKEIGGKVKRVKLLNNLCHGFLNFTYVSPECRKGSDECLEIIKEALDITEEFTNT